MTSIFAGTRLAFLVGGGSPKERSIIADEDPVAPVKKTTKAKGKNYLLKACLVVVGLSAILVPLFVRNARMNNYQNSAWQQIANQYNKYQQQYSAQQQYNGQNGQNGQYQQAEGKRFYDVNNCKWYNFNCNPYYVDEQGNYVSEYEMKQEKYRQEQEYKQQQYEQQQQQYNQQYQYNGYGQWYGQGQRDRAMEVGTATAALRFVYAWQILMWIAILGFCFSALHTGKTPVFLLGALFVWFQFNFLAVLMLADAANQRNEAMGNLSGYYGQFSVLMMMTNVWYAAVGLVLGIAFYISHSHEVPTSETAVGSTSPADEKPGYEAPAEPEAPKGDESDYVKVV